MASLSKTSLSQPCRPFLSIVRAALSSLFAIAWLGSGFPVAAQPSTLGLVVQVNAAMPGNLAEPMNGELYIISKSQWEKHRDGDDGVAIRRPGEDFVGVYPVQVGVASIPANDLLQMEPSDPEKDVFTLLFRTQTSQGWINAWWTFCYKEWERNWDSPLVQEVYVYVESDLWTEKDRKYNVADGVDKQVFVLEPQVDVQGNPIVHPDRDPVVLVHGLHGQAGYWTEIPGQLRSLGYDVWQFYYPGDQNIRLTAGLLGQALDLILIRYPGRQANLVGHSMGGLVARAYLEGLGLLGNDEETAEVQPYRGNVRKWVSLSSPHYGSFVVAQFLSGTYHDPDCKIGEWIKGFFRSDYREEPAFKQIAMGSRFMWDLNQSPFPADLSPQRDLLSVIGTETPMTALPIQGCVVTDSVNDGAVDLISASLLDHRIPLVAVQKNHASLVGQSYTLLFISPYPLIENRDTTVISGLLHHFLDGALYSVSQVGIRIVQPGQDPYQGTKRTGLSVRYVNGNGETAKTEIKITDLSSQNVAIPPVIAWNQNDTPSLSVPDGPPLAYGMDREVTLFPFQVGLVLASDDHRTFSLTANGRSYTMLLQSGYFTQTTLCEATAALAWKVKPAVLSGEPDRAVIGWETNLPATTEVYGLVGGRTQQYVNPLLVTDHTVLVAPLQPGQPYIFTVRSVNACGREVTQRVHVVPLTTRPVPQGAGTATVLVFDVSGSMGKNWSGGIKIESAKAAAEDVVVRMIQRESQAGSASHQVALATFTTDARLDLPLTTDYDAVRRAIQNLRPQQETNIGAGLQIANQALASAPPGAKKIIVLLSDGVRTVGPVGQEILAGPVQEAAQAGTCIYTVGFGAPGDLDEGLLKEIAIRSGCGAYSYADTPVALARTYIRLRHEATGQIIGELQGQVAQGETVTAGQIKVPSGQGELHLTLDWPGSYLDLRLTDPRGRLVDAHYPRASLFTDKPPAYFIIRSPQAGDWRVQVHGVDVPEGVIPYDVIASVRGVAPGSWFGGSLFALVAAILAGLGTGLFIYQTSAKGGEAILIWNKPRAPEGPGFVRVRGRVFTIGHHPRNSFPLSDPKVSSRHAQIVRRASGYVLTDLRSLNHTYVNGEAIRQKWLLPGDKIRVGDTELIFQVPGRPGPASAISAGPAYLASRSQQYVIPPAGGEIGRDPRCTVHLVDPQVSRRHARLDRRGDAWVLTDLESTGGTFVNGEKVDQKALRHGDEIRVGRTTLRFLGGVGR
ncbi:MAG: FHA domain-containing protein [Anaerolineae bacterium]|nr:FHA domain-containing protein [Anaerolineae bacterium]